MSRKSFAQLEGMLRESEERRRLGLPIGHGRPRPVTPTLPRVARVPAGSGLDESGTWTPEFDGQRPPFRPADPRVTTHGAYSEAVVGPLADRVVSSLGVDGPGVREYVQARVRAELVVRHLATLDPRSPEALAATRLLGRISNRMRSALRGAGRLPEERLAAALREALGAEQ